MSCRASSALLFFRLLFSFFVGMCFENSLDPVDDTSCSFYPRTLVSRKYRRSIPYNFNPSLFQVPVSVGSLSSCFTLCVVVTMAHRSSSSSITYKWRYDVFLSFYGDDTRLGFVSHLYESLRQRGIHAFIDYKIRDGENITPALFKAIEESRIAIIVFSENYANSTFCLQELEKIVDCFKKESRLIYPVFYYVDPSDLRRTRGSYADALARLEERFKDESHKVEKWRQALSQAADLKGYHLKPKIANEQEFITRITSEVAARISFKPFYVTDYPVGLESRVKKVISCLDLWSTKEIKMIGIWGAGGIGKSTVARAVYNSIANNFEGVCFLSDVRKQSKMLPNGLLDLQKKLLGRLVMEKDLELLAFHEGITIIKHRLSEKKILLILDDVDKLEQLKALVGSCDWFGNGSRIIITTRNKQLLKSHGIRNIYDVKELNGEESRKLLTWHAFKKEHVDSNYMEVCKRVTHYCCGFPLVLEVIGSYLCGQEVSQWSSTLDQFKSIPHTEVFDILKLSFDMLQEVEKQVFLDVACFFNGKELAHVNYMLLCIHGIQLESAIGTLVDKSLIKIKQNRITMHDLIEDLGKEIVRQESSYEPGERSRLWFYKDILHVLQQDTGTNKVEAIILDLLESIEVQWSGEELMKMKNLKMLVIRNACFSESPKYLPDSLRWLEWKGYSCNFLPLRPTQLFYLDLSNSSCEFLQPFDKKFLNLSRMNLRNCKFLQQIPDLSRASNLTELCLDDCTNLTEIHDSVGCLIKLRELSAMRCKNLKTFPSHLRLPSLERLVLHGCSSLQTFPEIPILMEKMKILYLSKTAITELPYSICNLIRLCTLWVDECPNLKQLPASICRLRHLIDLSAIGIEGLSHFKTREGGDEESLYGSAMSLKMIQLCFSNCNFSNDSLAFCLSHFTNTVRLDLSFNNFTILPECIKEYHNLKHLLLNNCIQLKHIGGMPPNLHKFSAICCTSLTESSKRKVLKKVSLSPLPLALLLLLYSFMPYILVNFSFLATHNCQALNIQPRKRNFILPGNKLPKGLHYYNKGSVSFWFRNVFPLASLWILCKDHRHHVLNSSSRLSVRINQGEKMMDSSAWGFLSTRMTDHIYMFDMQSIILSTELPLVNKWNQVEISLERAGVKEICFGVHVYNLQSNLENIQFVDPRRYIIVANLLQKIQDWKDVEEDMNLDSTSTCYQERDIMEKLRPYWDLVILEVDGHSYNNLIEFHQINCKNCWRIPALGHLPALRTLTIEGLESVEAIGSEFFHGDDSTSFVPFPSLETLHFENMISWEEWTSIDVDAFPKLHTLRFHDCPKLIGNLPRQLLSLKNLEIERCPLLASFIPNCPYLKEFVIIKSPNVVLQEQELPPSLSRQTISERDIMEKLRPYWHLQMLKVDGHSYNNLIELHHINCTNCWRFPALGHLPSLSTLTIQGLECVVVIGSEFFHGDDFASHVPFPSLEYLHFENMISWEEWNSIAMDAFPKLHTLCFHDCPKLIGNLPRQLLSLKQLEIEGCPLLASSIPNSSYLWDLVINKSPNVVLQGEDLPSYIKRLTISGRQMSEPLFEKMDVEYLTVQDCPDAVPFPVIHMPHSVKGLTIVDCENLKFDLVLKAPLCHLRRISIYNCKFLRSLFDDMKRLLPNLEELLIKGCPELEPFSITLPSSLKQLEIRECDKLLSCLTELHHLPTMTQLCIYFPSAPWHCVRHGYLTSQELQILDSPNIEKIGGEIMPPSQQRLHIYQYRFLSEECGDNDEFIWPVDTDSSYLKIGAFSRDDMNDTTLWVCLIWGKERENGERQKLFIVGPTRIFSPFNISPPLPSPPLQPNTPSICRLL